MTIQDAELMTAIVTPFDDQLKVDDQRLATLIEHLLKHGTQGLIVGATTGEAPTLTDNEKLHLLQKTVEIVDGRVPIIAGTGSNSTQATIDFTQQVSEIEGIDAALVVVPYYNKPDQAGLIAHFTAVADQGGLPVMIYNIPSRVVVKMEVDTVVKLAQHPNIIGIKQCTTIEETGQIVQRTPDDFLVFSGEDSLSLATKEIGGNGVISVASHIYGDQMTEMFQAINDGDLATAARIQRELTPKMAALFAWPSPAPVKAALNHMGIMTGDTRLPLLPLTTEQAATLFAQLEL